LGKEGMKFPRDLSLICLGDSYMAKTYKTPISVYAEPRYEMGKQALQTIENIISGQTLPGEQIKIEGDLIIRKSCGLAK